MPRPSFGCATCRLRRVKCDEREGGCAKCESYGVQCPGYQDRFDVVLRLQTARTEQGERSAGFASSSQPLESSRLQASVEQPASGNLPINYQLALDQDATALAIYLKNNCVDGQPTSSLEQIQAQGNGCLFAAIKVLSNVDIVRKWSLPNGPDIVAKSYQDAIQLLNAALASPHESRQDSTLLSTLIMSTIEMRAAPSMSSTYWEAHTKGAAALLQIRGADQVTTQIGSALYFQVSSQLMTSCIVGRHPLPPEMVGLREAVLPYLNDNTHPVWRLQGSMARFTEFYAAAASPVSDPDRASTIIADAYSIYCDVGAVFEHANAIWHYQKIPSNRFPNILDYEHNYQTVLATHLWNSCRIAIILLCTVALSINNVLVDRLLIDPEITSFLENAIIIINEAALDTIASVPQALALMVIKDRANHLEPTAQPQKCSTGHTHHAPVFRQVHTGALGLPYMHGCLLQWSVYFAAQSEFVQPHVRRCLWEILEQAGKTLQVKQWQNLAEQLKPTLEGMEYGWQHLTKPPEIFSGQPETKT